MINVPTFPRFNVQTLTDALILTRREIRDTLRDWRILMPILILTTGFPWVMNFTTNYALKWVEQYQAQIIPIRLIPFGMMVVGFFPISFSLIIALESFVGEKERNSLEPLLTTPLSDESLYFGKLFAAIMPPLAASFLGISVYLGMMYFSLQYVPDPIVLTQVLLLTTMEAFVMVTGAVVVSSHATSVRAANLLASFIIVPMAFLIQANTFFLFYGSYDVLWLVILGMVVLSALLIRSGVRTFNREELLSRELDELNLLGILRAFFRLLKPLSPWRVYRDDVPRLLRAHWLAIAFTALALVGGVLAGWVFAAQYPFPVEAGSMYQIDGGKFKEQLESSNLSFLPRLNTFGIFRHNVESLSVAALLGLFSFGVIALVLLIAPMGLVGFFAEEAFHLGYNPLTFLLAFIVPHGIFELPAAILATAFTLRLGAAVIAPPSGVAPGENLLRALADLVKIFVFVVLPMLLVAAWIEVNITPQVVIYFFGK